MKLAELDQKARVGDLVFFSGRAPYSWLIRLWSWSQWSHVGVVVYAANDDNGITAQIVDSLEGTGVHCLSLMAWGRSRGRVAVGRVELSEDTRLEVARYVSSKRGCKYASPWQFVRSFSLLWSRLHRLFGLPDDQDPTRYFCSELVAEALLHAGLSLPKHPSDMTPGDVAGLPFLAIGSVVEARS